LAARGHEVILFERNEWLGGKAAVLEANGYRFDMGPTILTVPAVLERILGEADSSLDERLEMVRLDPQWRCFFDDGSVLDLNADVGRMAGNISEFTGSDRVGPGYRRFIELSRKLHDIAEEYSFWQPVGSIADTFKNRFWHLPRVLIDIMRMRPLRTVAGTVRKYIRDARVAQMADHFTQYVGSSPYAAPAILCGIAHMQTEGGIWYPIGGTRAVPVMLADLARELGVELHNSARVTRIAVSGGSAEGVELENGESFELSAVVSNCDSWRTYSELLGEPWAEPFVRRWIEPACSGVVLYLGLDRRYEQLAHHDFVFSRDPEEEFRAIYEMGEPAPDPTCYLCAPAGTESAVAPAGGEALYVLVHTPYLRSHHDWDQMLPAYRDKIIGKLERTAGLDSLESHIVYERALTPAGIEKRYNVLGGAIYGFASHGRLRGAFKPSNRRSDVSGLYLAGGSAHPGAGMPMAMMSGWIAADALDRDSRQD
jgi:phytoene desaturase